MDWEQEKVRQARESFDRILRHAAYGKVIRDDRQLAMLLELVQDGSNSRILDIGTGTGYLAFPLAEAYPQAVVYGIDIAQGIMEENRRRAVESGRHNLIFQAFDGIQYPFERESFDLIVSRYAFHHFPDPAAAVEQMYQLLSPGGRVLISDPLRSEEDKQGTIDAFMRIKRDGHIRFYTQQEMEQLFAGAGLQKRQQVLTHMAFPFAPGQAYTELYGKLRDRDRRLYDITEENGTIWVKCVAVGNTIFEKN